jgi:hypothetical protein
MSKELDFARELVGSAIYAPDHYLDVITLACAATHRIDDFFSAPRILSLGLKGSGKSTILKVAQRLAAHTTAPTGVLAMTAPSYVADFRMEPRCTHLIDEINHLFGEAGGNGKNSKFYTYLNQGHTRDTAFAQYQESRTTLQIPIFGIAFLCGLGLACPEDLRDRSIILRMSKAPAGVTVSDFSDPETRSAFDYAGRCLGSWMSTLDRLTIASVRGLHPKLTHRTMDVWGPLFTVALEADGGEPDVWVKRLLVAFERIELDASVPVFTPDTQLLLDYLKFVTSTDSDDGVASGEFALFSSKQEHGAYASMKPGAFKQFAGQATCTT